MTAFRSLKSLVLSLVCVIFAAASCTKKNKVLEYGLELNDTLRINLKSEPPNIDWNVGSDTTSSLVMYNVMDGLTRFEINDPKMPLQPALAESWKASDGGRTWTFKLRKGVLWTDGVEFTAQHVLDAWELVLTGKSGSEYAYFLFPILNAEKFFKRETEFKNVGASVNGKGELVVKLERPMSYFPMLLSHHAMFPARKDILERFGDRWTEPGNIQTLGAYKLKIWDHDKALVMERYDGYYGEKAKIRYVLGYMINEYATALNLYRSGKLDFQETVPANEIPALKKLPGFHTSPSLTTYYIGFNTKKAPFTDARVRRAFVLAVDRQQITDLLNAGHEPLSGWIPKGVLGHDDGVGLKFDAEAARKILDEAGFKDRSRLGRIVFGFNTNENHQRIAENVQAQLRKNIGVSVELANEEWKVYLNRLKTDPTQIFRIGWQGDYPDPDTFMNLMTSSSEQNYTKWGSAKYDKLSNEGASSMSDETRRKIYREAQRVLLEEEVPVMPVYNQVDHVLLSERVKNFPLNSLSRWEFKGVTFQ